MSSALQSRALPRSGVGGESDRKGPTSEADCIRRTGTEWRTRSESEGLRDAAAGPEGSAAHPAPPGKATIKRRRPTGRRPSAAEGCPAPGGEAAGPRPPEPGEEKRARFTSTRPAPSGAGAQDCCWRPRQLDDRNKMPRSNSKASCHKRHAPATTAWPIYRCCPAREPARFERASASKRCKLAMSTSSAITISPTTNAGVPSMCRPFASARTRAISSAMAGSCIPA